jgi:hypothetical protein
VNAPRTRAPRHYIAVEAVSQAAPSHVFSLLRRADTWPSWSLFDTFRLERRGHEDLLGVGAVRLFGAWTVQTREEVTELIPDRKLSYVLLSGLPLRDYRAEVLLCLLETGGTMIHWSASFDARFGTGWFWRAFMRRILAKIAAQLASAAEARAAQGARANFAGWSTPPRAAARRLRDPRTRVETRRARPL